VKQLGFALVAGLSLGISAPSLAQSVNAPGFDFIEAVKKSDGNKATDLLTSHPAGLINTKDSDGNTALLIAINRNDEQWTAFILNKGADPNVAGPAGNTPLIAASRIGFEQAVDWLLTIGAKVDGANHMGETPLIVAVQQRELPIVRMLLNAGANPDKADSAAGYSARDYAKRDPRAREILKLIDGRTSAGKTAAN
jgi:ankyrin repeat protein